LNPRRPGARAAALAPAVAVAFALIAAGLLSPRPASAQLPTWTAVDSAWFEIFQDDRLLGTEEYRSYFTNDTLVVGSTLRLTGVGEGSRLPRQKNTTMLSNARNSYPLLFQVISLAQDTTQTLAINCVFTDTAVVIYHESKDMGRGESIGLPPGRLYVLEPGIYAQVQTLAGDFARGSQVRRRQPVLIPSMRSVVDIHLTRGPKERLGQDGHVVETTRVELTDKLIKLVAWVDAEGRMWKMEAPGQGLRVERQVPTPAPASKARARKKG
jgi:hypothetical protein